MKRLSFKKIFSHSKKSSLIDKKGLYSPHRDWMIIVLIFFLLLILTIAGHSILYLSAEKGSLFNETAEGEIFNATLKKSIIDNVIDVYDKKETNFNFAEVNRPDLTDPSNF